jgi:hypothetical protein
MPRIILMAIMLAVTVAGCNRFPDLSIQVTANLEPDEATCTVQAEQERLVLRGLYDLNVEAPYTMAPRIESYIVDNSTEIQGASGNIRINSFDVTIKLPDNQVPDFGESLPNPYRITTSAVIPPSAAPGGVQRSVAAAPMIPVAYQDVLRTVESQFGSIVLDVRANGTTAGGFNQQSPAFSWPIELCSGCLGIADCPDDTEGTCLPGQDSWTYCTSFAPPTN